MKWRCWWLLLAALAGCRVPGSAPDAGPASRVRVAIAQWPIRSGRSADELAADVAATARRAADGRAGLLVFPELVALDCWQARADESERDAARRLAVEVTPSLFAAARAAAAEHRLAILVGGPIVAADGVRNRELLAFADGRRVLQDKLFLTAWERQVGWRAGDRLHVFAAPWGTTAIATCYDVEFPRVTELLAQQPIDVLLVPSMTESEHGRGRVRTTAAARAVEHHAFVVVAATVGRPAPDWRHFGTSCVFAPHDGPFSGLLADAEPDREQLLFVDLDVPALRASRAASRFAPAVDQRARDGAVRLVRGTTENL